MGEKAKEKGQVFLICHVEIEIRRFDQPESQLIELNHALHGQEGGHGGGDGGIMEGV